MKLRKIAAGTFKSRYFLFPSSRWIGMCLPCTMPAGEGSFKTSYLLSLVRVDGIADTAAKKGPPPFGRGGCAFHLSEIRKPGELSSTRLRRISVAYLLRM